MKISDHIYVYFWNDPRENNCNSIFIDGKVPLLIDPGHLQRVDNLFWRMREDGVRPEKIQVVICTHGHPDHFEGAAAFRGDSVKIGISQQEEKYIEDIGRKIYTQHGLSMPPYRVDFYLKDGDLVLGKHEFQILVTPGHSPGSISIYWPRHKILFSGDVVFDRAIGRTDLPGGDARLLIQSIDRLSKLPIELIIPGHGPAVQGKSVQSNFDYIKKLFAAKL